MNTDQQPSLLYSLFRRGGMLLFCLIAAAVTGLCATGWAGSLFFAAGADGEAAIVLEPGREEVPDLSSRMIYVSNGSRGYDVTLPEGAAVTVRHGGAAVSARSRGESVSALLARCGVRPGSLELIGVTLSGDGAEIDVSSELTYYDYVTEPAPFATRRIDNPDLPEGTERVVQEGTAGVRSAVYEVVCSNGALRSRRFVEELSSTAVERIVEVGTARPEPAREKKASGGGPAEYGETGGGVAGVSENAGGGGVLTLKDGTKLNYSAALSMTATAYTTGYDGVGTVTASGTAVHVGSVAVDKSVVPLGTRVYVVAGGNIVYGLAVAEDTGVKGSCIDLYYDTYGECVRFGRRPCTVYILE